MFKQTNFDDIYLRNLSAGLLYLLHNNIFLPRIVDYEMEKQFIPFHLALGNSEQWLLDHTVMNINPNPSDICNNLQVMKGLIQTIPSGILTMGNPEIMTDWLSGGYLRTTYEKDFNTEFALESRELSAMTTYIPLSVPFTLRIVCSSANERLKVWQQVVKTFYKITKFWYAFEGWKKLDGYVAFPETFTMETQNKFAYSEKEDKPIFDCSLQVVSYMPVIDITTERFKGNKIGTVINRISLKD